MVVNFMMSKLLALGEPAAGWAFNREEGEALAAETRVKALTAAGGGGGAAAGVAVTGGAGVAATGAVVLLSWFTIGTWATASLRDCALLSSEPKMSTRDPLLLFCMAGA